MLIAMQNARSGTRPERHTQADQEWSALSTVRRYQPGTQLQCAGRECRVVWIRPGWSRSPRQFSRYRPEGAYSQSASAGLSTIAELGHTTDHAADPAGSCLIVAPAVAVGTGLLCYQARASPVLPIPRLPQLTHMRFRSGTTRVSSAASVRPATLPDTSS